MGNPAGVKRDFEALEKRRLQAIGLLEKHDLNQSEVARRLQVCRQTVSRWMDEFRDGGQEALKKAGRAGRKPELTEADRERLEELLLKGPEKLGYETPLWTCARVAHLIEDEFGIEYHRGHVWKVLDDLGWSCQRPRDERASGMRKRSASGGECAGPPLKKSPKRRAHDHLHRRKWNKPTAAPCTDVVASRRNSRFAIQLQLGHDLSGGRNHLLQFLFPAL